MEIYSFICADFTYEMVVLYPNRFTIPHSLEFRMMMLTISKNLLSFSSSCFFFEKKALVVVLEHSSKIEFYRSLSLADVLDLLRTGFRI